MITAFEFLTKIFCVTGHLLFSRERFRGNTIHIISHVVVKLTGGGLLACIDLASGGYGVGGRVRGVDECLGGVPGEVVEQGMVSIGSEQP